MDDGAKAAIDHILNVLNEDRIGKEDWHTCGSNIEQNVENSLRYLKDRHVGIYASLHLSLGSLINEARREIESKHHSKVERRWRRVYTDAAVLRGITTFLVNEQSEAEVAERASKVPESIKDLDIAIVQSGAPGHERLEMIHLVIKMLQQQYPSSDSSGTNPTSPLETSTIKVDGFCLASKSLTELDILPSLSQYHQEVYQAPFVVREYASDWAALKDQHRRWSDFDYLKGIAGPCRVVPVEIGKSYLDENWSQAIISWTDFLTAIGWDDRSKPEAEQVLYLAQHNLFKQFPSLEEDIEIPELVYACPPPTKDFAQYRPPIDEDGVETCIKNAWIGPKGTTSPPHFDPHYNAYVQVVGHKLVWLADPKMDLEGIPLLDGNSFDFDVFDSRLEKSAKYENIENHAMKVIMSPGDLLVMPPGWLHGMQSLTKASNVAPLQC